MNVRTERYKYEHGSMAVSKPRIRSKKSINVNLLLLTYLGLVADPVIEAIARLEFKDGFESSLEAADTLMTSPLETLFSGDRGEPGVKLDTPLKKKERKLANFNIYG